jgi:hypothetical protein
VRELLGAGRHAGEVAVPEADELERVLERLCSRPALRSAGALVKLGAASLVLLLGQELEFLGERGLDRLACARARAARLLEQRLGGPRANASARARSSGSSAMASARSPSPSDSRAQARAVSGWTPRAWSRSASSDAGSGSKRTGWQRDAIVGSTCDGLSVSSRRTTYGGGSSSVLSSALAASSFIVSARSSTNTRCGASNGV